MKLIGITGKGGSGKTELSTYLVENKENVVAIHVDDIVDSVKNKYLGFLLSSNGEDRKTREEKKPKLKSEFKKFFYSNKVLFDFWMNVRSNLIKRSILSKIEEYKRLGKEIVLIDDWAIETHKYLKNKFEEIYVIERPYIQRRQALKDREELTVEESKVWDMPYALEFYKVPTGDNVTILRNQGSLEEWHEQAEKIYEKLHTKTFDERIAVQLDKGKQRGLNKVAVKSIRKLNQIDNEKLPTDE